MKAKKTKEPGVLFGLSLKVTIALILTLVSLLVILMYIFMPAERQEIAFATAVAGGAAVVYGGYYAGLSLKIHREEAKKEASFRVLENLQPLHGARVRRFIESEVEHIPPKEVYSKISQNIKLLSAVTTTLALWEDMSIGIQYGYLDEDVLFYSLSFLVPWHFKMLRSYIEEERSLADQHLYIEMQKLAEAWESDKSLMTGKTYSWAD